MASNVAVLEDLVFSVETAFQRVAVDTSINFARESEFAIQQITKNDYAMKLALSNKQSVRDAVTNVAAIGISLNPARKQAYLVPRDGGIMLDISYMGLLDLAVASGSIRWGKANIVHENDVFKLNGFDQAPTHDYAPFARDRGAMVGVYVVVKTPDGDYLTDHMTIDEVFDIRDRTSAWKAWIEKKRKNPWVTDEGEMIKKTIIKRASKTWPRTARLDQAVHHLNTDAGEGLDLGQDAPHAGPKEEIFSLGATLQKIREATSLDAVRDLRREGLTAASRTRDKNAYDRINAAVERRRNELSATDVQFREVKQ